MRIVLSRQAENFLRKLRKSSQGNAKAAADAIKLLANNFTPPDSKQMDGEPEGCRRIPAKECRIIYSMLNEDTVEVEFIGYRPDVYELYKEWKKEQKRRTK